MKTLSASATLTSAKFLPGMGAIDLKKVLDAIDGIGYDGFVTVELYPYEDQPIEAARLALSHLQTLR